MDFDWTKIRLSYITSNMSVKETAEKFGVKYSTLQDRATREKWAKARKDYRQDVTKKTANKIANSAAKKLSKEYRVATKLTAILQAALKDDNQFRRYIITEASGEGKTETKELVFEKIDMQALSAAAKVLQQTVGVKKTIGGWLNAAEQDAAELAKRRIELEEKRGGLYAEAEEGGVIVLAKRLEDGKGADQGNRNAEVNAELKDEESGE